MIFPAHYIIRAGQRVCVLWWEVLAEEKEVRSKPFHTLWYFARTLVFFLEPTAYRSLRSFFVF